eukprot:12956973-Alexandrium_andersonii.AAC.1
MFGIDGFSGTKFFCRMAACTECARLASRAEWASAAGGACSATRRVLWATVSLASRARGSSWR